MAEFASLVLAVDSRPVVAGTQALDRLETQAHQTERAARAMSTQMAAVGNVSGQMRMQVQNAAFQVGDMATQIASGTQASRALAMQLPQLLGGFGLFGAVAGAAVAILAPLAAGFFDSGNAADDFADALGRADDAMSELNGVVRSISGLEDQYAQAVADGNLALADRIAKLIELRQAEAEYQLLDLPDQLREQEAALADLNAERRAAKDVLDEAAAAAQDALNGGDRSQIAIALNALDDAREAYDAIANSADMAGNKSEQLRIQIEIAQASLEDATEASSQLDGHMLQAGINTKNLAAYAGAAVGPMNALLASARSVDGALYSAAVNAARLAQMEARVTSGPMGGARGGVGSRGGSDGGFTGPLPPSRPTDIDFGYAPATGGGSPGGGGAVDTAEDLREAYDNLMGSLDPLVNAQQDLAEGTRIADDALAAGVISAEEHAAAIGKLGEEYADATNKGSVWTDALSDGIEDLGDAFGDFIASGMKDFDGFAESLRRTFSEAVSAMVAEAAAAKLGQALGSFAGPVGSVIGSIAGSLIGGLFGGGSTPYEETEQYDIDQEKAALIQQMHVLEGHSNYLKRQEIEAYDESNQALARKVQLLEEEAAIEAERMSLQMQLWELEGNTEAIRAAQLEQLDESNRALQEQIWAQQDLAAATAETTRAIEEAIAAISPDDYSTQFAYDRAIALAKNGYIPPDGTTPATSANPQQAQVEQTAAMNSQLSTLTSLMRESLTIMRQWNANGLPPEAA